MAMAALAENWDSEQTAIDAALPETPLTLPTESMARAVPFVQVPFVPVSSLPSPSASAPYVPVQAAAAQIPAPVPSSAPGAEVVALSSAPPRDEVARATTVSHAINLLRQRGFTYVGPDPVGLPCYRSPSGALLIGVGSCRSLAYARVNGKLQVIAAARTTSLVCRIAVPGATAPLT